MIPNWVNRLRHPVILCPCFIKLSFFVVWFSEIRDVHNMGWQVESMSVESLYRNLFTTFVQMNRLDIDGNKSDK